MSYKHPTRLPTESEQQGGHFYLYWDYSDLVWTPWTVYTFRWSHFNGDVSEWNGIGWGPIGLILVQGDLFDNGL